MSNNLIELSEISKVFLTSKVETHALADISLSVNEGDFFLIRGASGSGKSTLLSMIGLLDYPTSGRYNFRGSDTLDLSLTQRARLRNREFGFVFQSFNLLNELNIRDNVGLPLRYRGDIPQKTIDENADRLMERVGISHRAEHFPPQLSGGQQQRAAIARALIGNPTLILADEPTGNLDEQSAHIVLDLFANMHHEGSTICVVSHDPIYRTMANQVLSISEGRIEEEPVPSVNT